MSLKPLERSKVFHYPLGHVYRRTSTVGELMAFLSQYPQEMPVLVTWEGTIHSLSHPDVEVFGDVESERCEVLTLNAEYEE